MKKLLVIIFILIILKSGCVTPRPLRYHIVIDSISSNEALEKKTYFLLPANKDISINDLQFKEYSIYVKRALISRGFQLTDNIEKANIVIFLAYGIGDPKEHYYSYSIPVWGQTGVSSSKTTGNFSTFGNFGNYSSTTNYTPSYGVTGHRTQIGTYKTYFRYMFLDAYDLYAYRENQKEVHLWRTFVASTGSSSDLRRVLPILVAASNPYIGKNTGQKVEIILNEDDQSINTIKGIEVNQLKNRE